MTDTTTNQTAPVGVALVADDSPANRLLYAAWLHEAGFEVLEAVDGDEAVALIGRHHPDLVVCDTRMPGRSGTDVCRWVRQTPAVAATPFLQVSAQLDPDLTSTRPADGGADAYLEVPAERSRFLELVQELVRPDHDERVPVSVGPVAEEPTVEAPPRDRRRVPRLGLRTKMISIVITLLIGTLAVTMISLSALSELAASEKELFSRDVRTVELLGEIRVDVQEGQSLAQQLITANTTRDQDAILRDLDSRVAPDLQGDLVALQSLQSGRDGLAPIELERVGEGWRALLAFVHSAGFRHIGTGPATVLRNAALAEETNARFSERDEAIGLLLARTKAEAEQQVREAQASFDRTRRNLLVSTALLLLLGATLASFLARSVTGRIRSYSAFATEVAEGTASTLLKPTGNDEITQLGHALNHMVSEQSARQSQQAQFHALTTALLLVADEEEAHLLIRKYLERMLPGATAVILTHNNSADRLEARTPVAPGSPLADRLTEAGPLSCRAIRTGQVHDESVSHEPLLHCSLCFGADRAATCTPLLVGGQVIGSFLTTAPVPLTGTQRDILRDAVTQSAPVLANLRNLAVAEHRASVDTLTGLATRRALEDVLPHMVAQAGRQAAPLSALMLDLDHFKNVNDSYGHELGDQMLAATGVAISSALRASDFAARFGGEEFVVLLPATEPSIARGVAEKIRAAIAQVRLNKGPPRVTASVGIAALPDHAVDAETLLRMADRALYAAKGAGRDLVVIVDDRPSLATEALDP